VFDSRSARKGWERTSQKEKGTESRHTIFNRRGGKGGSFGTLTKKGGKKGDLGKKRNGL